MMEIYQGSFSSWKNVVLEFHGLNYADEEKQNNALEIEPEPDQVLLATYGGGGYDGDAVVCYRRGEDYFIVEGSHCSCYGLEDQWQPEKYSKDIFLEVLDRKIEGCWNEGGDYPSSDKQTWRLIKSRVGVA